MTYSVTRRSWIRHYRPAEARGLIDYLNSKAFVPSYVSLSDLPVQRDELFIDIDDPERVVLSHRGIIITTENFRIESSKKYLPATVEDIGPE